MLDPVTVLCGCVVMSVQAAAAASSAAEAAASTRNLIFMARPISNGGSASEPEAHADREGPRPRIDVVVDPVQPRLGVDAAVAREGEHVLHGTVDTRRVQRADVRQR